MPTILHQFIEIAAPVAFWVGGSAAFYRWVLRPLVDSDHRGA